MVVPLACRRLSAVKPDLLLNSWRPVTSSRRVHIRAGVTNCNTAKNGSLQCEQSYSAGANS